MTRISKMDMSIFAIVFVDLFFLRYIKVQYVEWYFIDLIIIGYVLFNVIKHNFKFKVDALSYLAILLLTIVIGINISKFGFGKNVIENTEMFLLPSTLFIVFIYFKKKYTMQLIEELLYKFSNFLNFYFFINTLIIVIQINTGTFMMKRFLAFNSFAPDHMAGLIGANGVSVLNYVWIMTAISNIYFYLVKKSKARLMFFLIQTIIFYLLSDFIDNKMFIFTFILHLFLFFLFYLFGSHNKINIVLKLLPVLVLIILVAGNTPLFSFSSNFTNNNNLLTDFIYNSNITPDKNNERVYLNYLAFSVYDASEFGIGLNNVNFENQTIHRHLGINSSSLVMIQGGLILLISIINFYCVLVIKTFSNLSLIKKIYSYVLVCSSLFVTSFATQPFRDHYIIASLMIIYMFYYLIITRNRDLSSNVMKERKPA